MIKNGISNCIRGKQIWEVAADAGAVLCFFGIVMLAWIVLP
jgi:hypothetical protein